MQISISVSETAHWHALIGRAEFHVRQLLPYGIEDYLVRLFMRFERNEKPGLSAVNDPGETSTAGAKLQNLGDQCLLLCGFYPEASDEYGVPLQEFVSMGREAYEKLAKIEHDEKAIMFEYLADNFAQVTEMLCYIHSTSLAKKNNDDALSLYGCQDKLAITFNPTEHNPFSSSISQRVLN